MKIPKNFRLQYKHAEIDERLVALGAEISGWAKTVDAEKDILGVPVLRGAVFFFADLVRQIATSVDIAPVRTWAYESSGTDAQALKEVRIDMEGLEVAGRNIVLVDDICDSGRTLAALKAKFLEHGAKEVKTAVLIKRLIDSSCFDPDYYCFEYDGPEWFVGYGMDDHGSFRNLSDVYLIEGSGGHILGN